MTKSPERIVRGRRDSQRTFLLLATMGTHGRTVLSQEYLHNPNKRQILFQGIRNLPSQPKPEKSNSQVQGTVWKWGMEFPLLHLYIWDPWYREDSRDFSYHTGYGREKNKWGCQCLKGTNSYMIGGVEQWIGSFYSQAESGWTAKSSLLCLVGLEKQMFRTVHQGVTPGTTQVTFDSLQKYGDSFPFPLSPLSLAPYPVLHSLFLSLHPLPSSSLLFYFCFVSNFHLLSFISTISLSFLFLLLFICSIKTTFVE